MENVIQPADNGADGAGKGFAVDRRQLLLGGFMMACAGATVALAPKPVAGALTKDEIEAAIPTSIGPYSFLTSSGFVLPPEDELTQQLYQHVLTRVYVAENRPPLMLLMAYGGAQNLTLELHRPDKCYPPQGFKITDPVAVPMALGNTQIEANALAATRADRDEEVIYWARIGQKFPRTAVDQALAIGRENLAGRMPDGVLTRISIGGNDQPAAIAQVREFIQYLVPLLSPAGRRLVLGRT